MTTRQVSCCLLLISHQLFSCIPLVESQREKKCKYTNKLTKEAGVPAESERRKGSGPQYTTKLSKSRLTAAYWVYQDDIPFSNRYLYDWVRCTPPPTKRKRILQPKSPKSSKSPKSEKSSFPSKYPTSNPTTFPSSFPSSSPSSSPSSYPSTYPSTYPSSSQFPSSSPSNLVSRFLYEMYYTKNLR